MFLVNADKFDQFLFFFLCLEELLLKVLLNFFDQGRVIKWIFN